MATSERARFAPSTASRPQLQLLSNVESQVQPLRLRAVPRPVAEATDDPWGIWPYCWAIDGYASVARWWQARRTRELARHNRRALRSVQTSPSVREVRAMLAAKPDGERAGVELRLV